MKKQDQIELLMTLQKIRHRTRSEPYRQALKQAEDQICEYGVLLSAVWNIIGRFDANDGDSLANAVNEAREIIAKN